MAVPSSGQLREYADIGVELGVAQTNVSLRGMSQTAGFSTPDAMSEFYGYSGECTTGVADVFGDGSGVALYQLDNNASDASGNYSGTATDVTYGEGHIAAAAVFNGSSSYINAPSPIGQLASNANDNFTVSIWLNFNTIITSGADSIIARITSAQSPFNIYLYGQPGGLAISLERCFDGKFHYANGYNTQMVYPFSAGVWYNLVVTYVGATKIASAYVNNSQVPNPLTLIQRTTGTSMSQTMSIGADVGFSTFNGKIDQVRIFNKALSASEVTSLYSEQICSNVVGGDNFNTVVYSGTGTGVGVTQSITGVGFQPDLVWVKSRTSGSFWHNLADSVRGVNRRLFSNEAYAEDYDSSGTYTLLSFDSDGFTVGRDNNYNSLGTNNYVAWCWKAGGAAVTNTDGTITSQVSANTEAGFSIVSFNASTGSWTAGHGLNGAPKMVIYKNRDISNAWAVWVEGFTDKDTLYLNLINAKTSAGFTLHGSIPTSTTIGCSSWLANSGDRIIAYCFTEVSGYSSFGSYTGNGSINGPIITTGFEPAFVMTKRTDADTSGGNWLIFDNKRDTVNPNSKILIPNLSIQELDEYGIDFNSTGFQIKATDTDINRSGYNYIYMAFAK